MGGHKDEILIVNTHIRATWQRPGDAKATAIAAPPPPKESRNLFRIDGTPQEVEGVRDVAGKHGSSSKFSSQGSLTLNWENTTLVSRLAADVYNPLIACCPCLP